MKRIPLIIHKLIIHSNIKCEDLTNIKKTKYKSTNSDS